MTVEYGELAVGDADRCAELEAQLFPGDDPWSAIAFVRELESKHNHYVAARVDGVLVGYAGISRLGRKPPYEYEIHTIGVDPDFQGRGIGRELLDRLLAIASGGVVFLEVRTDNAAALGLYQSAGFVNVGLRKRYYRVSGADAYTMRREAQ
ncbi:ribosomal protein S18-alanine N-acetyltransferase [Mycobacterium sp. URHB0044]|uniref:ribosomal protein S18-alanine N-acetyltransferase n=1 Tax=Mycobacterium sp. URHB0044 TaxID=1380386 RepID=UPI00048C55C9|nr:ribosomal protein S18-alanine N-acetyltransferase [Mycobacterium sp. URHB0044]